MLNLKIKIVIICSIVQYFDVLCNFSHKIYKLIYSKIKKRKIPLLFISADFLLLQLLSQKIPLDNALKFVYFLKALPEYNFFHFTQLTGFYVVVELFVVFDSHDLVPQPQP